MNNNWSRNESDGDIYDINLHLWRRYGRFPLIRGFVVTDGSTELSWAESDDRLWAISVDWTMRNPIHTYIILKPKLEHRGYTLHHIASHYITLLQIVSHCITLHHIASHCITLRPITSHCITLRHSESHCFTLHRIAAYCITCTASNCITLHHIASQYIPLHHSASLYITLHHHIALHHMTITSQNQISFFQE